MLFYAHNAAFILKLTMQNSFIVNNSYVELLKTVSLLYNLFSEKVHCERNNGKSYNEKTIVSNNSYLSILNFFDISITACKLSSNFNKTFTNSTVEQFYRN